MGNIWLPSNPPSKTETEFKDISSMVIVGANGSGKSRLGAWIDELEGHHGLRVQRVSAQRALLIQEFIQPRAFEQAERLLYYGSEHKEHNHKQKHQLRWQGSPTGHFLNDFDFLMSWLFAEHSKATDAFREQCRTSGQVMPPLGETKREQTLRIWQEVMPQRRLVLNENKITAKATTGDEYHGREMSDGERVTLYLIAQSMAAPPNAIVVIDEPELHLHQAIQSRLWDQVEAARPDCLFVYITHDLAFAASRTTAKKIWVKDFNGKDHWDWQEVPTNEEFPERLTLQILGSRRPILFVEGDKKSLDTAIYRVLFPERLVIPRGSCEHVVQATITLNKTQELHHTDAVGLIDRDHRSDEQLLSYKPHRVFSANVAEIESLLLTPEAIEAVCKRLGRNAAEVMPAFQEASFKALDEQMSNQINERATVQIQQRLNSFPKPTKITDSAAFAVAYEQYVKAIDPKAIYEEAQMLFQGVAVGKDYPTLLKFFNQKALVGLITGILGINRDAYQRLVIDILKSQEGEGLRLALRQHFDETTL